MLSLLSYLRPVELELLPQKYIINSQYTPIRDQMFADKYDMKFKNSHEWRIAIVDRLTKYRETLKQ
ncbi:hypothetical protein [Secundilactobacillus kimchicus]|uniref:hypothetical protein n=1 Tax=Secundilactobacillus kimchicus TaxID=528209 RepID=UPI00070566E5|nr:hypothetical protein [Secundilactobacillus kimchicus]